MTEVTGYQIAQKLFEIHTHGELCKRGEVVYREKDVIKLLVELGLPEPDFQMFRKVYQFWNGKIPKGGNT